ncbi:CPBP family intramembrane glutamic endopeptidase [Geodermatophilus sp. SYSU D00696]
MVRRVFRRHPVASLWTVAVLLEVALIAAFLLTGAQATADRALEESGIGFNTDLVTAVRLVVEAPYAAGAVGLAIAQVAAPDLALLVVAGLGFGSAGLLAVRRRWRPWSREVGRRRGLRVWVVTVVVFSAMNLASAGLHWLTLRDAGFVHSPPSLSLSFAAAFLVAMFLDAGAVFEESAWRGFALPLLQARYAPVAASVVLGVLWSAWHVPVKFDLALLYGPGGFAGLFAVLTVKFVLLSLVMAYFCNRVGISVPLAVVMHGLSNDSVRLGGFVDTDVYAHVLLSEVDLIVPMAVVAAVLVWRTQGRLGLPAEPAAVQAPLTAGARR